MMEEPAKDKIALLKRDSPQEEIESAILLLNDTEYDRRSREISELTGLRISALDKIRSKGNGNSSKAPQGKEIVFDDPLPGNETVDCSILLDDIVKLAGRYIILPEGAPETIAVWVLFSWLFESFEIAPSLGISAPEKGSGKTTAISFVSRLARRALPSSNFTAASVFRLIERSEIPPTLLFDEAETFIRKDRNADPEMVGILNSGFNKRFAWVLRTVETGGDYEPRLFSTWAPKSFAFNGRLPGTLQDRSIIISMQRKLSTETIQRLRENRDTELFTEIKQRLSTWAAQNSNKIASFDPVIPSWMGNREADKWCPLFAIADCAGGHWPETIREAAKTLSIELEEDDYKITLLRDIRGIFADKDAARIPSVDLVEALLEIETSPWSDWNHGKGVSPSTVAKLLKNFSIKPKALKFGDKTYNGYERSMFAEVFPRYLENRVNPQPEEANSIPDNDLDGWPSVDGWGQRVNHESEVDPVGSTINQKSTGKSAGNSLQGNELPNTGLRVDPEPGVPEGKPSSSASVEDLGLF